MTPGTVLGGRYRLDDLLTEHDGARFWRATDTVLSRSVGIHAVASDDPRAEPILDAARLSARVTDPHFLRVLDCDDSDGLTWVVNEWGTGASLDMMVQAGPLPPERAAWITREVADAITAAHAAGICHGRLNPENVMVTDGGAVKVIGSVVYAVFAGPRRIDPARYGALTDREADVIDLAGILYTALTGRWPGVSPSTVPPAPREGKRQLRPRQVRAGVPRTLDAICDRVLNKEASQHVLPIETAYEIAAVLSDYVGDPAGAPLDVTSTSEHQPVLEDLPEEPTTVVEEVAPPEPTVVEEVAPPEPTVVEEVAPPEPTVVEEVAQQPSRNPAPEPHPDAAVDPDATMAAPPPLDETMPRAFAGLRFSDLVEPEEWEQREEPAPPPPFELPADRPLFADTERRVPASPTPPAEPPGHDGYWPFEGEPSAPRKRRSWVRPLLVGAAIVALLVAMYLAFDLGKGDDEPGASPSTPAASGTPLPTGTPLKIFEVADFDPEGDPPEENPDQTGNAIDGDPATGWRTSTYKDNPQLGGLKSGVGLVLDLGSEKTVGSVQLALTGRPTSLEIFATPPGVDDPPTLLADARRLTGLTADGTTAVARFDQTRTRYLIVWLTRLPPVAGGFRGQIDEVAIRP